MTTIFDLAGKRGLVVGIAHNQSIATGCAAAFWRARAELAITYLNEKAEPHVRPIAESFSAPIIVPCDVCIPGQLERAFGAIEGQWGSLILYCIPSPSRRVRICTRATLIALGRRVCFCHGCLVPFFIRMAKLAVPSMTNAAASSL